MHNKKRLLALLLCLVFLLAVLSASAFLVTHLEHIHTGEGCMTCIAIRFAGRLLAGWQLSALLLLAGLLLFACAAALLRTRRCYLRAIRTLCTLKVRLTE